MFMLNIAVKTDRVPEDEILMTREVTIASIEFFGFADKQKHLSKICWDARLFQKIV